MPEYNRHTQTGRDAQGYPTGATHGPKGEDEGWTGLVFQPGTGVQTPELNEMQTVLRGQIRQLGDYLRRDGQTQGVKLVLDLSGAVKTASLAWENPDSPGLVYYRGLFLRVPQTTLTITGIGAETVGLSVTRRMITGMENPDLVDPVANEENYGKPGAWREVFDVVPVIITPDNESLYPDALELYFLQSGDVTSSSNDVLNEVDQRLVSYTADIVGDCLIRGMNIRVEDQDDATLRVQIDRGRAYVQGYPTGFGTTQSLSIPKARTDVKIVNGEPLRTLSEVLNSGTGVPSLKKSYAPVSSPLLQVDRFVALTAIRKRGPKNATPYAVNPSDPSEIIISTDAPYGPLVSVVSVYDVTGAAFVPFTQTALGFRFTGGVPAGDIRVVWVYNAALAEADDFEIARVPGDLSNDRRTVTLLRDWPVALDNTGALNPGFGDKAQFAYPGIASTKSTASVTGGATDLLSVQNTYGIVVGQRLYLGGTTLGVLNSGTDEAVTVAEVVSSTQLRMSANISANHPIGSYVYFDQVFADLRIDSNDFQMQLDYRWLLDRIDVIYIDKDNAFRVQTGQSNRPAFAPSVPPDVLPLVKLRVAANGDAASVSIEEYPVKHQTQQELRQLRNDLDTQAYNNAQLSLTLETYSKASLQGVTGLRGVLTDPGVNSDGIDINQVPPAITAVSIDPERNTIGPQVGKVEIPLTLDTAFMAANAAAARVGSRAATLGLLSTVTPIPEASTATVGGQEVGLTLPVRQTPLLIVEGGHFTGVPNRPATWPFYNERTQRLENVPRALEGGFWRARSGRQPWLDTLSLYLPGQPVTLTALNLNPSSIYEVSIDGQRLGSFSPYTRIVLTGAPKLTDAVTVTINGVSATTFTYSSGAETAAAFASALMAHLQGQPNAVGTAYSYSTGAAGGSVWVNIRPVATAALPAANVVIVRNVTAGGSTMAVSPADTSPISNGGSATETFTIPDTVVSGRNARSVRVAEVVGGIPVVVAETLLGAEVAEVQRLPVAHDALAASTAPPVLQTFQVLGDYVVARLELFLAEVPATGVITVGLMECDDTGVPNGRLLSRLDRTINPGQTTLTLDFTGAGVDLPALQAGRSYAVVVLGTTVAAVLRSIANQVGVARAIATGTLTTSQDGLSKSVSATNSLMMRMYAANFDSARNRVKFNSVSVPTNTESIATFNLVLARAQQLVFRQTNVRWTYSTDANVAELDLPLDEFGNLDPSALAQSATSLTLYATLLTGTGLLSPQVGVKTARFIVLEPKAESVYVTRAMLGLAPYNDVRVALEALTAAGPTGITVKVTGYDDPYGTGRSILSGTPAFGDQVNATVAGVTYNFTFTDDGQGSTLARLATRLAAFLSASGPLVTNVITVGAARHLYVYRSDNQALVSGDMALAVIQSGGSSLSAGAASFNYIELVRGGTGRVVDGNFTEWVYTGEDVPQDGTPTLRVKIEVNRTSLTNYTRLRRPATVVFS